MGYTTIVADPPWPYKDAGKSSSTLIKTVKTDGDLAKGVAIEDYPVMSISDICALPVKQHANPSAHLYLWTTNAFMVEAHEVAKAWGFKPKTILTWVKVRKDNPLRPSMKTGFYFRGATEHVVFCVRGSLPVENRDHPMPTAFLWPRERHSAKPEQFYDLVQRSSKGPYLELFARVRREGWDAWGNEVDSDVAMSARCLA